MIRVSMPQNFKEYDPKLFLNMTSRQLIALGVGLLYSIPLTVNLPLGDTMAQRATYFMIFMLPALVMGWFDFRGIPFNLFIWQIIRSMFLCPMKRKYKPDYGYQEMLEKKRPVKKIKRSKTYKSYK